MSFSANSPERLVAALARDHDRRPLLRPRAPTSTQRVERLVSALHFFALELDAQGPCAEVEATARRLERDIRRQLPLLRPIEARIELEMSVQAAAQTGKLHPRVLAPFDMILLTPEQLLELDETE